MSAFIVLCQPFSTHNEPEDDALTYHCTMEYALHHLRCVDSTLALWIDQIGPCTLQRQPHSFATLAYAIISQQLSLAAARTIRDR
jgi:3-methyladenine DNA glycosylase/8-oxoguanine DNA glycosylase